MNPIDFDDIMTIAKELNQVFNSLKAKKDAAEWLENAQQCHEIANYEPVKRWCDKALELLQLDNHQKKRLLILKAIALLNLGRYEDALKDLESTLKIDPSYPIAYKYRGEVLTKLGRYDEAITSYDIAIKFFEGDTAEDEMNRLATLYFKGRSFHSADKNNEALTIYENIYLSNKADLVGRVLYFDEAEANFALGNYDKAIKSYDLFIDTIDIDHENPMDVVAFDRIFEAHKKLGRNSDIYDVKKSLMLRKAL